MKGFEATESSGLPVVAQWLTVAAVARLLGVTRGSVYRLADNGSLPSHRITPGRMRFSPADVTAYIEGTRSVARETPAPRIVRVQSKYDHGY